MTTDATNKMETDQNKSRELKHLGFVKIAAIHALACVLNLYDCAKQNSGPLRSAVGIMEDAVTTVVGPVYAKLKGVPEDLLEFVDRKVDDATNKFDEHSPPLVKQVTGQAHNFLRKASVKAQKLVIEARTGYTAYKAMQASCDGTLFCYIPLVHFDEMGEAFKQAGEGNNEDTALRELE